MTYFNPSLKDTRPRRLFNGPLMNILICDGDSFFKLGLMSLVSNLLKKEFSIEPVFLGCKDGENMNNETIGELTDQADIIFYTVDPIFENICKIGLLKRKKEDALLVYMQSSNESNIYQEQLPCSGSSVFKHRNTACNAFHLWLYTKLRIYFSLINKPKNNAFSCSTCKKMKLTSKQIKIAFYIKSGYSNHQISEFTGISYKTISAHRSNIMIKFNLKTKIDLLIFLQWLDMSVISDFAPTLHL